VYTDSEGRHELDPDQLLQAVWRVLKDVAGALGEPVAAVSFSCAMHSLIAVDDKGGLLTKAMTWADRRSEAYADAIKASEAGRRIYAVTGTPIHAMSPLCKLLWMKEQQPGIFRRAARFISIKEYIWWRLFGTYRVDHSLASATGLFDIRRKAWHPESLALAGIGAGQLSEPVPPTYWEAGLLPEWQPSGLPADIPFVIGASDGCLANWGTGAVRPGDATLTIGTSGALRMTTALPEIDARARLFSYVLADGYYVCGGATNNGGNVLQWYAGRVLARQERGNGGELEQGVAGRERRSERRDGGESERRGKEADGGELERLVAAADTVVPGSEGLVFLPYLLGERAPVWDAHASGVFFGIRSIHEQRHFLRALLEGVGFSLRQIGASLEETIGPIERIYASGGFTQSKAWLQMIADIFQKKVLVTAAADASAVGAALMGAYALGLGPGPGAAASLVNVEAVYEPDPGRAAAYEKNYGVFSQLYGRLKDLM
jgi:gluconokinase